MSSNLTTGLNVGERVKFLRERKRKTQREMGADFGCSYMFIYRLERNKGMTLSMAKKLCEYFHVSLNYLAYGDDQNPPYVRAQD